MCSMDFDHETMSPTLMRHAAPKFGLSQAAFFIERLLQFYLVPQIDFENQKPSSTLSEKLLIRCRNHREVGHDGPTCHWQLRSTTLARAR